MRALGATAEEIAAVQAQIDKERPFEIMQENEQAFRFFMRLNTQWNRSIMGDLLGLNYQSIEFLFRIEGIGRASQKTLMRDIQTMEESVLLVMQKDREKKGGK